MFANQSGALLKVSQMQDRLSIYKTAEAVDCNHHLIVWSLLSIKEWEHFQVVKPCWDDMELNHLITNTLALSINKINLKGAISVSVLDTN